MIVSVVIVNYRTPELTIECLRSLHADDRAQLPIAVLVADNRSGDNSVEMLGREIKNRGWDAWGTLLPLQRNGGFAYGNNRAIEKIFNQSLLPDYIWFLNPDTEVKPGACKALVEFLAAHPEVGVAGSRLESPGGEHQISAFRDHTIISELLAGTRLGVLDKVFSKWLVAVSSNTENAHQVDWVSGASMMIRREVFEKIGLLDENYFMYFEEVDFCIRARKAGWPIWYVPESRVVHLEGASTAGVSGTIRRRPKYWFESRRRFFLKNYGRCSLLLADLAWMIGYSSWRIRRAIQRKPDFDPPRYLSDFLRNSFIYKGFNYNI